MKARTHNGAVYDFPLLREDPGRRGPKTMLFWDFWKLHHADNVELVPGRPQWVPEGTYVDPTTGSGGAGRVYFDRVAGVWRRISAYGDFFIYESDDGIRWRPSRFPRAKPAGRKRGPHHVFTLPHQGKAIGWLYLDPIAADGFPFKIPVILSGASVFARAQADAAHHWHDAAQRVGHARPYHLEHLMLVSRDGLSWETRHDYDWGRGRINPEEPHFMFYNHLTGEHTLTCRPGLGDRRVCVTTTRNFRAWSEPRLVLQPDLLDGGIVEFYAMPVFPYGTQFIGLVWASHFATAHAIDFMVLHKGPQAPHLVVSPDGQHFARPLRTPFIELNEPGAPGCHTICPEGMAVLDDEIRIYSTGSTSAHGTPVPRSLKAPRTALLLHRLRRDGFMYFRSKGYWAEFTTRPFALFDGRFTMNAAAPTGEVRYELRDDRNRPIERYTFDACVPLRFGDALRFPLRWKERRNLSELTGRVIRLSVRFYNARIYSFRGDYHITDATDAWQLQDGLMPADMSRFGA